MLIICLMMVVAYWWDSMRSGELALMTCQHLCQRSALQLLDNTVVRQRIWLGRNHNGQIQLCRIYSFDYSDDNEARWQGYIVLLGQRVAETSMDPRHSEGRTIEGS
ncbi:MAG: DUF3301 domain-containing protein [Gammaproteobacteria bacterium]|nr:DUF3301 domain-containing protein [Gammaproteobacteria bacterium]